MDDRNTREHTLLFRDKIVQYEKAHEGEPDIKEKSADYVNRYIDEALKFMLGYDHDVIAKTTGHDDYDDIVLISDMLNSSSYVIFKELYYEKLLADISIDRGMTLEQIKEEMLIDYNEVSERLKKAVSDREDEIISIIDNDNDRYCFSIVDFGCTKIALPGLVDHDDLWDNDELEDFVINKRDLCELSEIGSMLDVTIEQYITGNGGETESAPDEVMKIINRYPDLITGVFSADDIFTKPVDAGMLELTMYLRNDAIACNRITLESGEVFYAAPDIDQVHELPEWDKIRQRNIVIENGIDDLIGVKVEKLKITPFYSNTETIPGKRTLQLIETYCDSISDSIEIKESFSYYQMMYLDPDDVLYDFAMLGKEIHNSDCRMLSDNAYEDTYLYDFYRRGINEIKLDCTEWLAWDNAIMYMSDNKLGVDRIEMMNVVAVDSRGITKNMDLPAEAVFVLYDRSKNDVNGRENALKANEQLKEKAQTLDLTQKNSKGR